MSMNLETPEDAPGETPEGLIDLDTAVTELVRNLKTSRHDMFSCLHGVMGFAELVQRERYRTDPEKHTELCQVILRKGQKLHDIIEALTERAAQIVSVLPPEHDDEGSVNRQSVNQDDADQSNASPTSSD